MKRGCPTSPCKARFRWIKGPRKNKVDLLQTIAFESFWKSHLDFRQRDLVCHMIEMHQRKVLVEWNESFLEEAKKVYDATKIRPYFVYDPKVLYIRLGQLPQRLEEVKITLTSILCFVQKFTKIGSNITFKSQMIYNLGCPCPTDFEQFVDSKDAYAVFELYWNTHPTNPRSCPMDSNLKRQKTEEQVSN